MKRRKFINHGYHLGLLGILSGTLSSCNEKKSMKSDISEQAQLQISLAQWSLNRAFFGKSLDPNDFALIAKREYDINAIEYVNQFYVDYATNNSFWKEMKTKADGEGVKSLLIMVDDEGDLGDADAKLRQTAAQNHFKWVDAAKTLGCHSIRVNAFGPGNKAELKSALMDGMGQLLEYAKKEEINILIENHGLHSSNGAFIADLIKEMDMPNFGTLPDFGNWCLNEKWGSTQNNKCSEVYDIYQGVTDFLPYARGVSAKSYAFDEQGNETIIDYKRMLDVIKDAGFEGYIGIEFEGENMSEPEGIRATKALLEKLI